MNNGECWQQSHPVNKKLSSLHTPWQSWQIYSTRINEIYDVGLLWMLCSSIHCWSLVVHHMLFGSADTEPQVVVAVVAPRSVSAYFTLYESVQQWMWTALTGSTDSHMCMLNVQPFCYMLMIQGSGHTKCCTGQRHGWVNDRFTTNDHKGLLLPNVFHFQSCLQCLWTPCFSKTLLHYRCTYSQYTSNWPIAKFICMDLFFSEDSVPVSVISHAEAWWWGSKLWTNINKW